LSPSFERLLGVAASGNHHLLLLGPKGVGKSHAIEWLIGIKPPLDGRERLRRDLIVELENFGLYSVFESQSTLERPSIQRVSQQVRPGALMGSATSSTIRPGVFALSHGGILVADELPEWQRDSREALREPLERQKITLTRAHGRIEMPAQFQLAATGNLCPCGGWPVQFPFPAEMKGDKTQLRCRCSDTARRAYLSRLSGPILDRIDLVVLINQIPKVSTTELTGEIQQKKLLEKVNKTQKKFIQLFGKPPGILSGLEIEKLLEESQGCSQMLEDIGYSSLRSRHKTAKLAFSLAVWDGLELPQGEHFFEASQYRAERLTAMVE
jgi:magnesium chelatase family protein